MTFVIDGLMISMYCIPMSDNLQQIIQEYFRQEHSKVILKVVQSIDNPTHDTFHELRVSLKRIRFIKSMMVEHQLIKSTAAFRAYSKMFRLAGQIREYQVHAYLLDKFGVEYHDEAYPHHFRKKEQKLMQLWRRESGRYLKRMVVSYPVIQQHLSRWSVTIPEYADFLRHKLVKRFGKDVPEKKLHRSRKILKALLYSSELDIAVKKRIASFCNLRKVMTLEDAIGDWHDLEVLLEEDPDKKVRERLRKEKEREMKKIRKLIPSLIRKPKE